VVYIIKRIRLSASKVDNKATITVSLGTKREYDNLKRKYEKYVGYKSTWDEFMVDIVRDYEGLKTMFEDIKRRDGEKKY
tara:strand:+ start:243 stop:479 length:237 start_codon:yes stop_codon:yes gene_type:complete